MGYDQEPVAKIAAQSKTMVMGLKYQMVAGRTHTKD
jgi:hypothetical protein